MEKKWKGFHCRKFRVRTYASFSHCCIMLLWMTYTIHLVQCNVFSAAPSWTTWMKRLGARPSVLCQKVPPSWRTASWEVTHFQEGQVKMGMRQCVHGKLFVQTNRKMFMSIYCILQLLYLLSSWLIFLLSTKVVKFLYFPILTSQ